MFDKVLIANRGAIVTRILRTLKRLKIKAVVVYAESDREAPYVHDADESYSLGDGTASQTYLDMEKILIIARKSGVEAIHPGYGFLSENADFINACDKSKIVFLGPKAHHVQEFGYKHRARQCAERAAVALVPGSGLLDDVEKAQKVAQEIGFPVILKSTAGGGGIGMQVCEDSSALSRSFESVQTLSKRNFGNGDVYIEAFIPKARHLEVQIFGDGTGKVVALGERDCSSQRRNQKVVEECPAPALPDRVKQEIHDTARRLGESVKYQSAGTVEFIYDVPRQKFYFLEVNTRLQVEHGVTELVWNVDLVEWMVRLGAGELPQLDSLRSNLAPSGHAIQARIYSEDPLHNFRPSSGLLTEVRFPEFHGLRIDHALKAGIEVSALYDPMIAKVISFSSNRNNACDLLRESLENTQIYGVITNKEWLVALLTSRSFLSGNIYTQWLESFQWLPDAIEILASGTLTTIQDYPGRQGYWNVGVPPSGPFDDWSFRLGNRLLENPENAAGFEITLNGPKIQFFVATQIVIAGSSYSATLNGNPIQPWVVIDVNVRDILSMGSVCNGMRSYLLFRGGVKCPLYLGSRSTFTLGQFGGHVGRSLKTGDQLGLNKLPPVRTRILNPSLLPRYSNGDGLWEISVCYGPHGAPDFFTEQDINTLFSHQWKVHYNSSRTGVRLMGPHPEWARSDGGEAGLHPSNIHDNAYAFGTIDFTGDMPIILGPDGPSLGGFVCPATVIHSDRWKIGQLAPDDRVKFVPVSMNQAQAIERQYTHALENLSPLCLPAIIPSKGSPILREVEASEAGECITYRCAGDDFLLIEFGPIILDISLRFRVHTWMLWVESHKLPGIKELTPGIRSLQIHYDPSRLSIEALLIHLRQAENELRSINDLEVETREIFLPISWDDPDCQKAIDHYQQSVRPGAPWCPSNLEFIRRINGLKDISQIRDIIFDASYLVMGLGDVYLGAPVATPLNPTQRLVTTKYNPARTWTAENSVGIGGAYLCVYGMEGPGGYQFVGRTLQMWNRYESTEYFSNPWLLKFFDQLRFYEVSHDELIRIRRDFPHGRFKLNVRQNTFRLADYVEDMKKIQEDVDEFRVKREKAFQEEIARWHANGQFTFEEDPKELYSNDNPVVEDGELQVESPVSGNIWKVMVNVGDFVQKDDTLVLIESMKMELAVCAQCNGAIERILIKEGVMTTNGQPLIVMKEI